jgi:pimeloyl-ACP methyl ester carboxylesterase
LGALFMNTSKSEFISVRGIRLHARRWGNPDAPMLFMLHGWMDVAASFQFVVDALGGDWQVIAPDMRGFGLSDWPVAERGGGNYWIQDYVADLDALLDHYAPTGEVNLVGHSMGANIVCLYAGVRPERVRRVVDLEGFGLAPSHSAQAPKRLRNWLDELRDPPQLKRYATLDDVAGPHSVACAVPRAALVQAGWRRALHAARRSGAQTARADAVPSRRSDGRVAQGHRQSAARRGR